MALHDDFEHLGMEKNIRPVKGQVLLAKNE